MAGSAGERGIVIVGVLPLIAAAVWLIMLREPRAAIAYAARSPERAHAETSGIAQSAGVVGVVVAGQDAELGAELGGEIAHVWVEPGARVKRGQPILQLAALSVMGARSMAAAQSMEDRSALRSAQLAFENARDKADRLASAPSAYSARDVQSARAESDRADADVERVRGSAAVHRAGHERELARADKQIVRAPFDGVLAARFFDVGDFVSPGQVVARVVDDARFVRFALPAASHLRMQVGAEVRALPVGSSLPLTAAVVDIDPELDPAAGLGFARAKLGESALRLVPGSRVEVFLPEVAP